MSGYMDISAAIAHSFFQLIGMSRCLDQSTAVQMLAALAQTTRMAAFRRPVAAYPGSIGAGDIARECKVPQNTMSTHLAILTRSSLLLVERSGRQMNYKADLSGFRAVVASLAGDCCGGRRDPRASSVAALAPDQPIANVDRKPSPRTDTAKPANNHRSKRAM
jgi:arsenate reductase